MSNNVLLLICWQISNQENPSDVPVRWRLHLHTCRVHGSALPGLPGRMLPLHCKTAISTSCRRQYSCRSRQSHENGKTESLVSGEIQNHCGYLSILDTRSNSDSSKLPILSMPNEFSILKVADSMRVSCGIRASLELMYSSSDLIV